MRLAISVLASLLAIAPLDARGPRHDTAITRIRPMQNDVARLLAEGMAHSPTFRGLVDRLERSQVIVYVDLRPDLPPHRGGSLRFLARSASDVFLKIHLNRAFSGRMLVALLGHELQHAVEVADANGITSVDDLRNLYQRLGEKTGRDQFDTVAARQVGYRVRQELTHGDTRVLRLARIDDEPLPEMEDFSGDAFEPGQPSLSVAPVVGSSEPVNAQRELVRQ